MFQSKTVMFYKI